MRPTTFICALAATLQLLSGTALADGWSWPIRGPVLTAYRNGGDPYAAGQHRGIDIGAPVGARVAAAAAGTVTFAGVVGSAGLVVSERTADGRFDLSYLHLSATAVHRGDALAAGATVGAVGTSGRRSANAPHLHFGVREAGRRSAYRDPLDFLAPPPPAERPAPSPSPVAVPADEPAVVDPAPAAAPAGHAEPARAPASAVPAPSSHAAHVPLDAGMQALVPAHGLAGAARPDVSGAPLPPILSSGASPRAAGAHAAGAHGVDSRGRPAAARAVAAGHGPAGSSIAASSHAESTRARPPHHGINLGWLAACVGLIALATALGHPDGTRRATARGRSLAGRAAGARSRRRGDPSRRAGTRRGSGGPPRGLQRHPARQ